MTSQDEWIYDPTHSVYYHSASQTYAIPDPKTGEWSYHPLSNFQLGESSTSHIQQAAGDVEKEEGEVDDDVGWGGLMEPEEVEKVIKTRTKTSKTPAVVNNINDSYEHKHPVYSSTPAAIPISTYDDPKQYAWLADEKFPPPEEIKKPMSKEILRLVVKKSESIGIGEIAVIDAREGGIQLGRDRCEGGGTARIRVREMEVSKTHAVVYWGEGGVVDDEKEEDGEKEAWWVVDLGSTHGTFIRPPIDPEKPETKIEPTRLSEPKHSSKPHRLDHLSTLKLGHTTFIAHIHPSWPCGDCQLTGTNEIPLDDGKAKSVSAQAEEGQLVGLNGNGGYAMDSQQRRDNREMKRKREMAALKEALLNSGKGSKSGENTPGSEERSYLDRSAMRRKLHPPSSPPRSNANNTNGNGNSKWPSLNAIPVVTSKPPEPVQSKFAMNIMANQGWTPGSGLGKGGEGRSAPIEVALRTEKRGLGAQGSTAVVDLGDGDWRQRGKARRYDELRQRQ